MQGLQASSRKLISPLEFNAIFCEGITLRHELTEVSKIRKPVQAKFNNNNDNDNDNDNDIDNDNDNDNDNNSNCICIAPFPKDTKHCCLYYYPVRKSSQSFRFT